MTLLELAAVVALAIAAALALALAWPSRLPSHRPIAVALFALLATDIGRELLRWLVLGPARHRLGSAPYDEAARVAFHIEQLLFLAASFLPLVLALEVLTRARAHRPILFAVWAELVLYVAAHYPELRAGALLAYYARVQWWLAVTVAAVIVVYAVRLLFGAPRPTVRERCALVLAGSDLAALAGPYLLPAHAHRDWWLAHVLNLICFGLLVREQGIALWRLKPATTSGACSSSSGSSPPSPG